jgi:hypothetical protein
MEKEWIVFHKELKGLLDATLKKNHRQRYTLLLFLRQKPNDHWYAKNKKNCERD